MWQWMYHDVFGVVNDILVNRLHILDQKVAWLANPATALPAIIAVDVWKTTPFMALLLLAGLQLIPGDVYEASTVDGAIKIQQFFQITLPLLKPALLVALIFRTLDAFRVFDVIYVMKQFAPETMTVAVYTRQQLIDLREAWPRLRRRGDHLSLHLCLRHSSTHGSSRWRRCEMASTTLTAEQAGNPASTGWKGIIVPKRRLPNRPDHRQGPLLAADRLHPLLHPLPVLLGDRLLADS